MSWKRTTTDGTLEVQNPSQPQPVAAVAVPVAAVATAPTYEPTVPVPVTSVTDAGMSNVATADRTYQPDVRRSYSLVRVTQFIWLMVSVLEALFAMRVILKLVAANEAAGFAEFITNTTAPFLAPFAGLMTNAAAANGSMLEVTTLVGMLVYALLAWGIVRLIWIVFERRIVR
jgi:uncharacterized protein YggT (Ycf19 family)